MTQIGATVVVVEVPTGISDARVHRLGKCAVFVERVALPRQDRGEEFTLAGTIDCVRGKQEVHSHQLGGEPARALTGVGELRLELLREGALVILLEARLKCVCSSSTSSGVQRRSLRRGASRHE